MSTLAYLIYYSEFTHKAVGWAGDSRVGRSHSATLENQLPNRHQDFFVVVPDKAAGLLKYG